ncbi:type VI secretion system-associated protein TagF [Andreprevotia chitinilytica]|uniref:type VI secretion system-associated protein TagF n=1 Tax=Andreprevotia chitinilytica TaxID=396808 RepID=UPI000A4276D0|nr:type VI secretion system-associated protein TagF [Andreprevotia chitinilytica]
MALHDMSYPVSSDAVGWYGKIPAAGDFVTRELPYPLLRVWERWMQNGLGALQQADPQLLARHYAVAPVWNFLLPAGLGFDCVQLGALAPSCDRVGRYYPVMAIQTLPLASFDNAQLDRSGPFYRQAGSAILDAIRHGHSVEHLTRQLAGLPHDWHATRHSAGYGDILAVLESPASVSSGWPDLSLYFDANGVTSFWWTHQGDGSPLQTHAHTGELNNALFARLFGPQQGYAQC